MKPGDIVIARISHGPRGIGADLSPCEAYARLIALRPRLAFDSCGVIVRGNQYSVRPVPPAPAAEVTP